MDIGLDDKFWVDVFNIECTGYEDFKRNGLCCYRSVWYRAYKQMINALVNKLGTKLELLDSLMAQLDICEKEGFTPYRTSYDLYDYLDDGTFNMLCYKTGCVEINEVSSCSIVWEFKNNKIFKELNYRDGTTTVETYNF